MGYMPPQPRMFELTITMEKCQVATMPRFLTKCHKHRNLMTGLVQKG